MKFLALPLVAPSSQIGDDLRKVSALVYIGRVVAGEQHHDVGDTGSAAALVLADRRDRQRLAHVFLGRRRSGTSATSCRSGALDNEHAAVAICGYRGQGHEQTKIAG